MARYLATRHFATTPGMGGIFDDAIAAAKTRIKSETDKASAKAVTAIQSGKLPKVKLPKKGAKKAKQIAAPVSAAPVAQPSWLEQNKVAVGLGAVVLALLAIRKWGPK